MLPLQWTEHRRFTDQVLDFHRAWQAFFYPRLFARRPMTAADHDRLPAFQFTPEPDEVMAARVAGRLGVLLGSLVIVMAGCQWRLARRDAVH